MTGLSARHRRVLPIFAFFLFASRAVLACSGRAHVEIAEAGVYALNYAAIVAAQPQLKDCRAADLLLLNGTQEVPIRVVDDGRGGFSRIEWLGQRLHGPQSWFDQYSNNNVYLLGAAPGAHARVRELPAPANAAAPAPLSRHLHFEQENLMVRISDREMKRGDEPDVWQWAKLTPIDAKPFTFGFDLPDADLRASAATVPLTLVFRGESNVNPTPLPKAVDHRVEVALNGKLVKVLEWDGRAEFHAVVDVPRAALHVRGNDLSLRVPRRESPGDPANFIIDVAMFNWFAIVYPVRGDFAADAAAFTADTAAPIEFSWTGAELPALIGSDGTWRPAQALGNGHYRAAGSSDKVDLYPFAGMALAPVALHAVADADLRTVPGYDYVIVAHPRLRAAIEPLAQYHREHGLKVAVADVNDVYDQFGGGVVHPAAIRDYIAWAHAHWALKPRYLLLVGDASFDVHHDQRTQPITSRQLAVHAAPERHEILEPGGLSIMGSTPYTRHSEDLPNRNLIPTFQFPTYEGQAASDNEFALFKPDDLHPQLAVGRLPVVEPDEVKAIVGKTLAYLEKPTPGEWLRDVTFVSTSEVESFKGTSDKIALELERGGYSVKNVYSDFRETDKSRYQNTREVLKRDLDEGNLLVHFIGHGGQFIWRVGPIGDLFTLDDVGALQNAGRYPMVLAMTCFSAPFDHPTDDSIGERFLREPDKGAVAVFAASWTNSPNPANSATLIHALLQPGKPIGDAIVAVKAKSDDKTFLQMYNLLGDPALVLTQPNGRLAMQKDERRWNSRLVVRVPQPDFGGDVEVEWIDAAGKIISRSHYQSRDAQFLLSPPEKAESVSVFALDRRNGYTAFGGMSLAPPPVPEPPAPAPKPPAPKAIAPIAPVVRPPPQALTAHDAISRRDFEAPTARAATDFAAALSSRP